MYLNQLVDKSGTVSEHVDYSTAAAAVFTNFLP